jgi:hypothetical protein
VRVIGRSKEQGFSVQGSSPKLRGKARIINFIGAIGSLRKGRSIDGQEGPLAIYVWRACAECVGADIEKRFPAVVDIEFKILLFK